MLKLESPRKPHCSAVSLQQYPCPTQAKQHLNPTSLRSPTAPTTDATGITLTLPSPSQGDAVPQIPLPRAVAVLEPQVCMCAHLHLFPPDTPQAVCWAHPIPEREVNSAKGFKLDALMSPAPLCTHLSVQVHPYPQAKVQQRAFALRCLELHAPHHLEPCTSGLLAVLLVLGALLLQACWCVGVCLLGVALVACWVAVIAPAHVPNNRLLVPAEGGKASCCCVSFIVAGHYGPGR